MARVLSPTPRLAVWAVVAGMVSMWLYAVLSPQKKLSDVIAESAKAKKDLARHDGDDLGVVWSLIGRVLSLAFRQLGMSLGPAVLASLPLVFLIPWLVLAYAYAFPAPDALVDVEMAPHDAQAVWSGASVISKGDGKWQVPWPLNDKPAMLLDRSGFAAVRLPLSEPVSVMSKRRWWHTILGNPAGYVDPRSQIDQVIIKMPEKQYLPFGPGWLRSWFAWFCVVMCAMSLTVKFVFHLK